MIITNTQVREYEASTRCCYCEEPFSGDKVKVHDHCHLTGKYRGASCSGCNINVRDKQLYGDVPLYFHNARGYDNNHIWRMLGDSDHHLPMRQPVRTVRSTLVTTSMPSRTTVRQRCYRSSSNVVSTWIALRYA